MACHASPSGYGSIGSLESCGRHPGALEMAREHLSMSTVCGRHAQQGEGRCSAEKYAAVCRSGIRGRPTRVWNGAFIRTTSLDSMRVGVFQAWCRRRSNWCWLILMLCIGGGAVVAHDLLTWQPRPKKLIECLAAQQGVAMQPVHHASSSAPPLEDVPASAANHPDYVSAPLRRRQSQYPTPPRLYRQLRIVRQQYTLVHRYGRTCIAACYAPTIGGGRSSPAFISLAIHCNPLIRKQKEKSAPCNGGTSNTQRTSRDCGASCRSVFWAAITCPLIWV